MRRAFHDAASSPSGPVFVSLPMSMLDSEGEPPVPVDPRSTAASVPSALDELAALLTDTPSGTLAIVAGDEVVGLGDGAALVALAEALGAPGASAPAALDRRCSPPPTRSTPACSPRRQRRSAPRWRRSAVCSSSAGTSLHGLPVHARLAAARHRRAAAASRPIAASARPHLPDPSRRRRRPEGDARGTADRSCRREVDARPPPTRSAATGATTRAQEIDAARGDRARRYSTAPMDPMAAGHALVRALPPEHARSSTRPSRPASTCAASTTGPSRATTSSARAAASAGGCPRRSASRSVATESPCSASSVTARPCTRRRRCGRPRTSSCRSCSRS